VAAGRKQLFSASRAMSLLALALFLVLVLVPGVWVHLLSPLFPNLPSILYDRTSFAELVMEHALVVFVAGALASALGVGLGVFVTRGIGRDFLPVVNAAVSIGQTFPPVAVLALAVPAVGFGAAPTIVALFLYGLLPIVRSTVSGLESVPRDAREAAAAMGMTSVQALTRVDLRIASPVIMAGVRTSAVISVGTATLGATIGAGGLGAPIIAGLIGQNPAYVIQGAVIAALFAIVVDSSLEMLEELAS
jgi:osmoprotectant transport system permease protein